jgi:hypothetical protein
VTVERGKILSAEALTLGISGSTYSIKLTDDHAPNVYVAATLLGPGNQFRQGYVTVEVEPSAQELQVELTAAPQIGSPIAAYVAATPEGRQLLSSARPLSDRDAAREMVQNALLAAVGVMRAEGREPSVAFLREGPYGIPVFAER